MDVKIKLKIKTIQAPMLLRICFASKAVRNVPVFRNLEKAFV